MNEDGKYLKGNQNRFICSICLNRKASTEEYIDIECCKRKSKSCPICQRPDDEENGADNFNQNHQNRCLNAKDNKTSQPDVHQGLTLLNEVLTVFQSKKQSDVKKDKCKTVIFKDACVETERVLNKNKLSVSKTLQYSIESRQANENGKFTVVCCQPETTKPSQFSIDLTKHKSISIPQMKLEELKNSLKDKTKSKDAIEEVNRMFAIVRKHGEESISNRPMVRSGPRVLPVVKTQNYKTKQTCANCHSCETNYQMSSGDSIKQHDCCYKSGNNCSHICCHCHKNAINLNTCTVCEHFCHREHKKHGDSDE